MPSRNRLWKLLGVAAVTGVATSGLLIERQVRVPAAYTPSEVTARLRERYQQAREASQDAQRGVDGSE